MLRKHPRQISSSFKQQFLTHGEVILFKTYQPPPPPPPPERPPPPDDEVIVGSTDAVETS